MKIIYLNKFTKLYLEAKINKLSHTELDEMLKTTINPNYTFYSKVYETKGKFWAIRILDDKNQKITITNCKITNENNSPK